jgi:glycosyltransferase involved in cell wall biosynthesis
MAQVFHIVTRFDGIGGTETHASELCSLLRAAGHQTMLWAERPGKAAAAFGATPIDIFARRFPVGGTLILLSTHQEPGIWLDQARPARVIVICNLFALQRLFAFLTLLERPTLPPVELVFVSAALREAAQLPGIITPPLLDLERFHPRNRVPGDRFRVGRHSRDDPRKHHRDDPSLYLMLAWRGLQVSLMGAGVLKERLGEHPLISLIDVGARDPAAFLGELDCFIFRPPPEAPEASGRSVMEALASGVPIVASANGGYSEWLSDGKDSFIAETQEEMLDRLLALSQDVAVQEAARSAARATAERICGEEARRRYLEWLEG